MHVESRRDHAPGVHHEQTGFPESPSRTSATIWHVRIMPAGKTRDAARNPAPVEKTRKPCVIRKVAATATPGKLGCQHD